MARFPIRQKEIEALARRIIDGLTEHADVFPEPIVPAAEMDRTLQKFIAASKMAEETRAAAKSAYKEKLGLLEQLKEEMKSNLRYAEYVSRDEDTLRPDDAKLALVGWRAWRRWNDADTAGGGNDGDGRFRGPGQVNDLTIVARGIGWIGLDWSAPPSGIRTGNGGVKFYKVQRRPSAEHAWELVAAPIVTEVVLKDQEPGVGWQYRVIAVNRSGEAEGSNVVCRKVRRTRWVGGGEVVEDADESVGGTQEGVSAPRSSRLL